MSMAPRILCKTSTLNNRRINGTRSRRAAEPEGRPRTVPRAGSGDADTGRWRGRGESGTGPGRPPATRRDPGRPSKTQYTSHRRGPGETQDIDIGTCFTVVR